MSVRIRPYRDEDLEAVAALWRATDLVMPYNDPASDIAFCRKSAHGEVFVAEDADGRQIATAMAGHDGHRGWIYYVAVDAAERRGGLGRAIVRHAEDWLRSLSVRKVQLLIREINGDLQRFYERLGYEKASVIVMQRWLVRPKA